MTPMPCPRVFLHNPLTLSLPIFELTLPCSSHAKSQQDKESRTCFCEHRNLITFNAINAEPNSIKEQSISNSIKEHFNPVTHLSESC